MNENDYRQRISDLFARRKEEKFERELSLLRASIECANQKAGADVLSRIEALFYLLRDIGVFLLQIPDSTLPEKEKARAQALFANFVGISESSITILQESSFFFDLKYLPKEIDKHKQWLESFHKAPPARFGQPVAASIEGEGYDEEEWEEGWADMLEHGKEILWEAFVHSCVRHAYALLWHEPQQPRQQARPRRGNVHKYVQYTVSNEWRECWAAIEKCSKIFLERLHTNQDSFLVLYPYCLRLTFDYPGIRQHCSELAALIMPKPRTAAGYCREWHYREILSPEERDECERLVHETLPEAPYAIKLKTFNNLLAEKGLLRMLGHEWDTTRKRDSSAGPVMPVNYFSARLGQKNGGFDPSRYTISYYQDEEKASIHMQAAVSFCGRNRLFIPGKQGQLYLDRGDILSQIDGPNYVGALIFYGKQYPSGEVLVQFENFVDRDSLKKLLADPKVETLSHLKGADIVRMDFAPVLIPDRREDFIQQALIIPKPAMAVAQAPSLLADLKQGLHQVGKQCREILDALRFLVVLPMAPAFAAARGTRRGPSTQAPAPPIQQTMEIKIANKGEFYGYFQKPPTAKAFMDFDKLTTEQGPLAYAAVRIKKDGLIEQLGPFPLKEKGVGKKDRDDCLSTIVIVCLDKETDRNRLAGIAEQIQKGQVTALGKDNPFLVAWIWYHFTFNHPPEP